jgi:hypothetical protein
MRKFLIAAAAVIFISGAALIGTSAGASSSSGQQGPTPRLGASCFKTFQSGTGNAFFKWCINTTGNIVALQSPKNFEHIAEGDVIEGYAVCNTGFSAFDNGEAASGWGPATFTAPNRITRSTTNHRFKLAMTFTQDAANRRIVVTETLTNTSGAIQKNVLLSRLFDGDIDNSTDNDIYVRTAASVIGTEQHGLELIGTTFNQPHSTQIESFDDLDDDTGCSATMPLPSPTTAGDNAGRFTYNVGTLGVSSSITLKLEYRLI